VGSSGSSLKMPSNRSRIGAKMGGAHRSCNVLEIHQWHPQHLPQAFDGADSSTMS
jgi:hypothetical protein